MMQEEKAFEEIFKLYFEPLFRFVHQYVHDEEECHDLVTAVYEDVWRNIHTLHMQTVKAYLYQIARNRTIDFLRKNEKRKTYVAYAMKMSENYLTEDRMAEHEHNQHLVETVLNRLGPPTGDILKACYVDGMKYKEVAQKMNMSVANVKKHMQKALKALKDIKNK